MGSFAKLATVMASTRRSPAISGGKRGAPVTNIASLTCTPLDPADPGEEAEIQRRLSLETPLKLRQTFVDDGLDIVEGDLLVVGGTEHSIRAVAPWTWRRTDTYLRLLVEAPRRS